MATFLQAPNFRITRYGNLIQTAAVEVIDIVGYPNVKSNPTPVEGSKRFEFNNPVIAEALVYTVNYGGVDSWQDGSISCWYRVDDRVAVGPGTNGPGNNPAWFGVLGRLQKATGEQPTVYDHAYILVIGVNTNWVLIGEEIWGTVGNPTYGYEIWRTPIKSYDQPPGSHSAQQLWNSDEGFILPASGWMNVKMDIRNVLGDVTISIYENTVIPPGPVENNFETWNLVAPGFLQTNPFVDSSMSGTGPLVGAGHWGFGKITMSGIVAPKPENDFPFFVDLVKINKE